MLGVPCALAVVDEICLLRNHLIMSCTIAIGANLVWIAVWCVPSTFEFTPIYVLDSPAILEDYG